MIFPICMRLPTETRVEYRKKKTSVTVAECERQNEVGGASFQDRHSEQKRCGDLDYLQKAIKFIGMS